MPNQPWYITALQVLGILAEMVVVAIGLTVIYREAKAIAKSWATRRRLQTAIS